MPNSKDVGLALYIAISLFALSVWTIISDPEKRTPEEAEERMTIKKAYRYVSPTNSDTYGMVFGSPTDLRAFILNDIPGVDPDKLDRLIQSEMKYQDADVRAWTETHPEAEITIDFRISRAEVLLLCCKEEY